MGLYACVHVCRFVCVCVCVSVCVCVCLQPCLQGEVEAEALAAGLARLSGPNLQRSQRGKRVRKQIGVTVCLPPCDILHLYLISIKITKPNVAPSNCPLHTIKSASFYAHPNMSSTRYNCCNFTFFMLQQRFISTNFVFLRRFSQAHRC